MFKLFDHPLTVAMTAAALQLASLTSFAETDVVEFVRARIAAGDRHIVVPRYRGHVTPRGDTYFELRGLKDVMIDFNGCDLFGTRRVRFFSIENCTNVVVRNLSLDYDPLAFTQARITAVGADGEWDLEVVDGYPAAPAECSYWPLQVYGRESGELINPMRCWNAFSLVKTGERTYRVTGGVNRRGEVGDVAVWPVKDGPGQPSTCAVLLSNCERCRLENLTIYSTAPGYCFFELFCSGNEYLGCVIDRRPPETDIVKRGLRRLRSANHDAFHSKMALKGPRLENCRFAYHCDDDVNLNSYYYIVTSVADGWVRVAGKGDMSFKGVAAPYEMLRPGGMLEVLKHTGRAGADLRIVEAHNGGSSTEADFAFLKTIKMWNGQDVKMRDIRLLRVEGDGMLEPGDAVTPKDFRAEGFVIRNCHFGPNRALGMRIRASDGIIESNVVDRTEGSAVWIGPEVEWPEGGMSHNVTVRGNRFLKCGGGVYLGGRAAYGNPVAPSEHRGMKFEDNITE